ncbi:MAG: hypothetical protein KKB51_16845 [Candidatus Riflebacteria bacterium]|nr:hypothetical protein [Candidatus Riflebacteria bacterium]
MSQFAGGGYRMSTGHEALFPRTGRSGDLKKETSGEDTCLSGFQQRHSWQMTRMF